MRPTVVLAAVLAVAPAATAADFNHPIFATPLPGGPGVTLPWSGPLAAPVITPAGTSHHGDQLFDVVPAGWGRDPFTTRDPGRYTTNCCDTPVACSAAGWVAFDFLLWATQGPAARSVVTAGPVGLGGGLPAAPGATGTVPLLGGGRVLNDVRPGFRFDFFLPVAADGRWGVGTRFEYLGRSADTFVGVAPGSGTTALAVPQGRTVLGVPVVAPLYVGFPGVAAGTVTATTATDYLGADLTARRALVAGDAVRLDGIVGYRYLHLGDRIEESWDVYTPTLPPPAGPRTMGEDSVRTRNNFHGGLLGLGASASAGRFSVTGRMAVSLGVTDSEVDQSRTRVLTPGLTAGGLGGLAPVRVTSLAGHDESTQFAVVPEFDVKLGWRATSSMRVTAGYSFLYWNRVRRAQDQYDMTPTLTGRYTDFWAQGVNLGVEWRY